MNNSHVSEDVLPIHDQSPISKMQGGIQMLTQQTSSTGFSRQDYNRQYYQINKGRIQARKKNRNRTNVLQLFKPSTGGGSNPPQSLWCVLRFFEIVALSAMSLFMTCYLIRESAAFYLEALEPPTIAFLKAGMIESTSILFSFSRGKSWILRWSQPILVVLLSGLTLWTMSGRLVKSAVQDSGHTKTVMRVIADLEGEVAQKEKLHELMIKREWIGSARKHEKGLDEIRGRLVAARQELAKLQAPTVIMNGLGILIAFRLLLVIANLICIHRVVEYFSIESVRKTTDLT